ncbi:PEGA domain-containing protein [Desulfovibrio gilichinskyi]|uniref:PEGA domain-containing protein n=1 Tax=Desulfovibrio gilichinskyi TaxID=1519643 RepID=A0A1X7EJY8_9BACT|nr:PEGA domain-containing protein [Desulfovibrio gilichinskyi]SMF35179.1 PEGA domain-containing protein [Desulfovibrio gilichinskyi]
MRTVKITGCFSLLFILAACGNDLVILKQEIPISTVPMNSTVYVDGNFTCTTPCKLNLTRNFDHILTFYKDGYKQEDVIIKREYQQSKVLASAVSSGIYSTDISLSQSVFLGVEKGVESIKEQEITGEAYLLTPSAVSLKMRLNNATDFSEMVAENETVSYAPRPIRYAPPPKGFVDYLSDMPKAKVVFSKDQYMQTCEPARITREVLERFINSIIMRTYINFPQ